MSTKRGWQIGIAGVLLLGLGASHVLMDGVDGRRDGTADGWRTRADEAFVRGDELARRAHGEEAELAADELVAMRKDAVAAWKDAARDYRKAFRLEDPTPERKAARALLAFRAGRAMSKLARLQPAAKGSGPWAREALLWFTQALDIEPALRQVHYERGVLAESEIAEVRDLERARMAYQAYLDTFPEDVEIPAAEKPRVESARFRVHQLAPTFPK